MTVVINPLPDRIAKMQPGEIIIRDPGSIGSSMEEAQAGSEGTLDPDRQQELWQRIGEAYRRLSVEPAGVPWLYSYTRFVRHH